MKGSKETSGLNWQAENGAWSQDMVRQAYAPSSPGAEGIEEAHACNENEPDDDGPNVEPLDKVGLEFHEQPELHQKLDQQRKPAADNSWSKGCAGRGKARVSLVAGSEEARAGSYVTNCRQMGTA
ncbi:uncharacterized protein MONBRDRAFT_10957 [Monosiga brevicollis MX1]|uniref:Uncharacterized protein n=1 Tax=Monosiga brevicollis TaxID=81824 RepID=A9V7S0_MONBE|nr:uncharacterized protein MONBRDRAFT_10957 [Monosiga brevicollis MX1]EDQ86422.1 predicted protein [Monosiga brevicollis MX1]|eukprot:XP_001748812.1 hypothetical protein [Monosiga brevicollis MX1]